MGKLVIITGASRGIGEALSYELAEAGYDLLLLSSNSYEKLNSIKEELISRFGVKVTVRKADVSSFEDLMEAFSDVTEVYALINNAAVSSIKLMTDLEVSEWERIIDINLNSLFYTSKIIVPKMLRYHEGHIINVSSMWGNVGASMEVAYSTAKGGVNSFTRALAKELAPSNIRVNAVAFGVIDTSMNSCFSKEEMESIKAEIPMDRLGTVQEAARMIKSVLEAPDYLTGQIITMDGGYT